MDEVTQTYNFRLVDKHASWTQAGPVVSRLPETEIDLLEGRAAATVAEPSTMALFGFATGTWMTGVVFGGFLGLGAESALAPVLALFAGVTQFIGGLYAFRRGNALGANAFCCYGAFNAVLGVILMLAASGVVKAGGPTNTMLAYLTLSFAFISLALMLAALRRNLVLTALFGALMVGYTLIGVSLFSYGPAGVTAGGVAVAGGALLFVAAACAYYFGMAMIVNSAWGRRMLPILGEP